MKEKEVYLWKVGDKVVHHTDILAASQLDGLTRKPDKTVTETQWSAAEGEARIIDGKIILGKTEQELEDEKARKRIAEIDQRFLAIEQKAIRPIIACLTENSVKDDTDKLETLYAEAENLRKERKSKVNSLSTPL